jgi:hypothetical protein
MTGLIFCGQNRSGYVSAPHGRAGEPIVAAALGG